MALSKKEFTRFIRGFNFKELFNEMGWNNDRTNQAIAVENQTFTLTGIAEKSAFKIFLCSPNADGIIPEYTLRRKIEASVTKLFREHLIIFVDEKSEEQIWQLVVRQSGRPARATETRYHITQDPELLFQRASGILFELDEEENITIVDVTQRITENFQQNNERVTKQFYERFSKEHVAFLKFIKGIEDKISKEWYASLMLNRLMFCYFIQKRGFLDNNRDYLWSKLEASQKKGGKNKFYSFYRSFLLILFHRGLGSPDHSRKLSDEIGNVPYLNGGLFEEHELETTNPKIDIEDKAFERIFEFFDQYEWHLDTRHTASGKDINPDVIGYIFEKYINDRADMGAYYTKEDITDYISKNCVLPYLFDEVKRNYAKAFAPESTIWQAVKTSGDEYVYDAVKYGMTNELPEEISKGINDVSKRKEWNKPASAELGLPTEIWREVVERRNQYMEVKKKVEAGEVQTINDFITHNLNIGQFVLDVIENTNDIEFLREFYRAINGVTIIDPTCGSGAFLFAAMNILEPLYEACIMRMRAFVEDEDRINKSEKATFSHKHKFFREVLEAIQSPQHPNLEYFIYKSIILRNLYGVDIMKEAVEIAKLRLFLRLVATVEADYKKPNLGLEPLPDIDFNIRAGNTLIGFATESELKKGLAYTLDGVMAQPIIEEKCDVVARTFKQYKEIQLNYGDDYREFKKAKEELSDRLKELNHELNQLLYKQAPAIKYNDWITTHQPFHWFAEFYEIMHLKGGFDVVIGNPPYLEFKQINYEVKGFATLETGAVHALCMERAVCIKQPNGSIGMIVPLSIVSTQRMKTIQQIIEDGAITHYANFSWRPAKLFDTVNRALTIFISNHSVSQRTFTTTYFKWTSDTRDSILQRLRFIQTDNRRKEFWIPKIERKIEKSILSKIKNADVTIGHFTLKSGNHKVYYRTDGGLYWKVFTDFPPAFVINGKKGSSTRETNISISDKNSVYSIISLLSSNTFWWWYTVTSNCRHLNPYDVNNFPVPSKAVANEELKHLGKKYLKDIDDHSEMLTRIQKQTGNTQTQSFKISQSKLIVDNIDKVLANHYGFSSEELDFIINYDIKYRMGKELDDED
jgi:hypothetical protein